jgi:hypothetical protein
MFALTCTDEHDRALRGRNGRQRAASFGVTVQFRHDDTTDFHCLFEGFGLVHRCLPDTAVHNKYDFVGFHCLHNRLHFIEQALLLLVATTGVDYDEIHALLLEFLYALPAK